MYTIVTITKQGSYIEPPQSEEIKTKYTRKYKMYITAIGGI